MKEQDIERICDEVKCESCTVEVYKDCEYVKFHGDLIENGNCFMLLAAYMNGEWNENTKI